MDLWVYLMSLAGWNDPTYFDALWYAKCGQSASRKSQEDTCGRISGRRRSKKIRKKEVRGSANRTRGEGEEYSTGQASHAPAEVVIDCFIGSLDLGEWWVTRGRIVVHFDTIHDCILGMQKSEANNSGMRDSIDIQESPSTLTQLDTLDDFGNTRPLSTILSTALCKASLVHGLLRSDLLLGLFVFLPFLDTRIPHAL